MKSSIVHSMAAALALLIMTGPAASKDAEMKYTGRATSSLSAETAARSAALLDGQAFAVGEDGRATATRLDPGAFAQTWRGGGERPPLLAIHGFNYDPRAGDLYNPNLTFHEVIRTVWSGRRSLAHVAWSPGTNRPGDILTDLLGGAGLPPRNACARAERHAEALAELMRAAPRPYDAVCHSMGCNLLALAAAELRPEERPRRALLLSPAFVCAAPKTPFPPADEVMSVAMWSSDRSGDRWAAWRAAMPGLHLRADADAFSDEPRWTAAYASRRRLLDHMASLELEKLWPLYELFLERGPDAAKRRAAEMDGVSDLAP